MASKLPAVKNSAYTFRCVLFAQDTNQIKSNPTIAAGDWKVSTDGAAFANLTTLPDVDPDSTVQVKVSLSADEMNGDEIMITAIDAAGDEWHSAAWVIHTAGQTFDTMEGLIDDLESRLTATRTAYLDNLASMNDLSRADVRDALGLASANLDTQLADLPTVAEFEARTIAAADYATATALATVDDFLDTEIAAILEDTGTTLPNQIAGLNNLSAAQVNAEVDTALADYDAPTKAELDAGLAGLNDIDATEAQAAAAAALAAYNAATEGDVTGLSIPTAATIADAVWDEATAGHATAGSTGAALTAAGNAGDPWGTLLPGAYGAGTAGAIIGGWDDSVFTAVSVAAAVNGSDLSIHRGDTFTASITGLGDISSRTQLYWTVKEHTSQADAAAVVQVEEDAGLMVLKGATAATAGDGDITVTNAATGAITLTLAAAATAELTPGTYYYDVQVVTASGVETLTAASLTVVADVTRAVV